MAGCNRSYQNVVVKVRKNPCSTLVKSGKSSNW